MTNMTNTTPKKDNEKKELTEEHIVEEKKLPVVEKTDTSTIEKTVTEDLAKKKKMMKIGIGLIIAVVLAIVGFGSYWLVYEYSKENGVKTWLTQTFPFPVLVVNGDRVTIKEFEDNVNSVQFFLQKQEELGLSLVDAPPIDKIRTNEIERLTNRSIMEQIATERSITVTQEDIDTYFTEQIVPQAQGGNEEIEKTVTDLYGWTVDEFKTNVLYEVVLAEKLQDSVESDQAMLDAAEQEANALYEEILASEDKTFEEFAQEYSDDTASAVNGGQLPYFARGVMVPEFEEAAFALEVEEISKPVKSVFGYHIIKLTGKDEEADKVEAQHILLSFENIQTIVAKKKEEATIKQMLPKYE